MYGSNRGRFFQSFGSLGTEASAKDPGPWVSQLDMQKTEVTDPKGLRAADPAYFGRHTPC